MYAPGQIKAHHSKLWWHEVRRFEVQAVHDLERYDKERERIQALDPKYNVMWTSRWVHPLMRAQMVAA